jgi:hypothetical protein
MAVFRFQHVAEPSDKTKLAALNALGASGLKTRTIAIEH